MTSSLSGGGVVLPRVAAIANIVRRLKGPAIAVSNRCNTVFQYALMLRYPNGRIFKLQEESERPLKVGHEFDAFGRRWKLEHEVRSTHRTPESLIGLTVFNCNPIPDPTRR